MTPLSFQLCLSPRSKPHPATALWKTTKIDPLSACCLLTLYIAIHVIEFSCFFSYHLLLFLVCGILCPSSTFYSFVFGRIVHFCPGFICTSSTRQVSVPTSLIHHAMSMSSTISSSRQDHVFRYTFLSVVLRLTLLICLVLVFYTSRCWFGICYAPMS